ncbi:MAG: hypothetical protein ACREJ3_16515 [Polyangiaceae bacterium]
MLDPLGSDGARHPQVSAIFGAARSICEVPQLADANADACAQPRTCDGCAPGWCVAPKRGCPAGTLRFVRGVVPRTGAELHIVCDLRPLTRQSLEIH